MATDVDDGAEPTRRLVSWGSNNKESLLPGLPDEITINHIVTKLTWRNVYKLPLLGHAWRSALKTREIHNARVRARSTQTLVAMIHDDPLQPFRNLDYALSLYDSGGDTWHLLPLIPKVGCGIPEGCGCVSVHGKLYIIGGRGDPPVHFSREVHVFDPAAAGAWKKCASMKNGRAVFACDVKDGKIYVLGGMGAESASEVYDPVNDVWYDIAPMLSNRIQHKVVHVGNEFFVHLGKFFSSDRRWRDAHFAEVYDACKDQWRRVDRFTGNNPTCPMVVEAVFQIYGRIFKILDDSLYIYHNSEPSCSWQALQRVSWDVLRHRRGSLGSLVQNYNATAASALSVSGQLLALVYSNAGNTDDMVLTPLRSEGLGRLDQQLVWKRIKSSLYFRHCHGMCTIEL